MRFSNDRFRQCAADLSRAIMELSIETRMADLPSDWIKDGAKVNEIGQDAALMFSTQTGLGANAVQQLANPSPVNGEIIPPSKSIEPIKGNITGAGFLADLFRQRIADTKATLAKAGEDLNAAVADLEDVATQAVNRVKSVKAETADLKAALGLSSNNE